MKNFVLFVLFLSPFLLLAQVDWLQISDPTGTTIEEILAGPDEHTYLLTGDRRLFRSADDADSWQQLEPPLVTTYIVDWTVGDDGFLYVYLIEGFLAKLPPGGTEWTFINTPAVSYDFDFLTVYPDGSLMLIDDNGRMHYRQGGTVPWVEVYGINSGVFLEEIILGADGTYFLPYYNELWRYTITGAPPVELTLPNNAFFIDDIVSAPNGDLWLFVDDRLYRSTNAGDDWAEISTAGIVTPNEVDFGHNNLVYIYDRNRPVIYQSPADEINWELATDLLAEATFGAVPVPLASGAQLFYNTDCGNSTIVRTVDDGMTYTNVFANISYPEMKGVRGKTTGKLFAKTCSMGWQVSEDSGFSWARMRINNELVEYLNTGLNDEIIAATYTKNYYFSVDDGESWEELSFPAPEELPIDQLYYYPNNTIVVTGEHANIFHAQAGSSNLLSYEPAFWFQSMAYHPAGYLFTASSSSFLETRMERIDLNTNQGEELTDLPFAELETIQLLITPSGNILYLGETDGLNSLTKIYLSQDQGDSFTEVLSVPTDAFQAEIKEGNLVMDGAGNIYFFNRLSVLLSVDDGLSWQTYLTDLPGTSAGGIYMDTDNYFYLVRSRRDIYRSAAPLEELGNVAGSLWSDLNGDCLSLDADEPSLPFWSVAATGTVGNFYGYTNNLGGYQLALPEGDFTVSPVINHPLYEPCLEDVPVEIVIDQPVTVDFPLHPTIICPLVTANVSTPLLRRCFDNIYAVRVCNEGTEIAEEVTIDITLDPFFDFQSSTLDPIAVDGQVYTFAVGDLPIGFCTVFHLTVNLSCEAELGQQHCISWLTSPGNECIPTYQTDAAKECQDNIGSYDPNDKRAFVDGVETTDYLLPGTERMTYQIRFQNTGTDTAFTVLIEDELPAALDVTTFHLENYSHPCEIRFTPGQAANTQQLSFLFRNILLPDSTTNEPASHGFVKFSIVPKEGLEMGEGINNFADIFFDFNEPVRTNTVALEYNFPNEVRNLNGQEQLVRVYPNPTSGQISIMITDDLNTPLTTSWYNAQGEIIRKNTLWEKSNTLDVDGYPAGLYFLRITRQGKLVQAIKVLIH